MVHIPIRGYATKMETHQSATDENDQEQGAKRHVAFLCILRFCAAQSGSLTVEDERCEVIASSLKEKPTMAGEAIAG